MQPKIVSWLGAIGLATTFLIAANEAAAQSVPSSTPCSQRYKLAWEIPFRSSDVGQSLGNILKRSEFSAKRIRSLSRMAVGKAPDGTVALQMNIPRGENANNAFFLAPFGNTGVDAACLSLRVFLEPGFEWPRSGAGTKMGWGLWGGQEPNNLAGGTNPDNQDGFSLRNVNGPNGFRLYSYNLNRTSKHGQYGPHGARWNSSQWGPGRWHTIEVELVLNTPGTANGYAQLWLDGLDRRTMTNLVYRRDNKWGIRGLMVNDMWGGNTSDPKHFSPKDQKMWYADYKLYTLGGNSVAQNSGSSGGGSTETAAPQPSTPQAQASNGSFGPIAPAGDVSRSNITAQWSPEQSASKYFLKVVNTGNRATVVTRSATPKNNCNGSVCSISIGTLSPGQYVWMVRPVYGKTNGDYQSLTFATR